MSDDTCKSCHKPITWINTSIGGRIPLDRKPLRLFVELRPGMWQRTFCYHSHLDTCVHRRPKDEAHQGVAAGPAP